MENVINLFDSEMPISEISKQTSIDVKTCVEYLIDMVDYIGLKVV